MVQNFLKKIFLILFLFSVQSFAQQNWDLKFSNNSEIKNIKLIQIKNDSLEFKFRKMLIKTPIDSIKELKKITSGIKYGFRNGASIGFTAGFVYGLLFIAPNQDNINDQLYATIKTSIIVGSVASVIGTIVGIFSSDEYFNFTNLPIEEKRKIINNIFLK